MAEDAETLSDHRYIHIGFQTNKKPEISRCPQHSHRLVPDEKGKQPSVARWATRNLDKDLLVARQPVLPFPPPDATVNVIRGNRKQSGSIEHDIFNTVMPRFKPSYRISTYYWSEEIRTTRTACIKTRRRLQRVRKKKHRYLIHEETLYQESSRISYALSSRARQATNLLPDTPHQK